MVRLMLLLVLLLSLAAATYILLDLRSDDPLAMTFCFGLPLVLVVVAAVLGTLFDGAVVLGRAPEPVLAGHCAACGEPFMAGETNCGVCGTSTGYWAQAERIRAHRAETRPVTAAQPRVAVKPPAEDPEPRVPSGPAPTPQAATTAARLLVQYAGTHEVQVLDTIDLCLSDPAIAKRVYLAAARRLHPDSNGGVHLAEWYTLRAAIDVLNRHHGM